MSAVWAVAGAAPSVIGRIGPNAITRVAEVLPGYVGLSMTRHLFERVGLAGYLATPPERMVDEAEVRRLHHALRDQFGSAVAAQVARAAGLRTAEYLLAKRIPKPVQWLLKRLPARWAARALLKAISAHAWTFVGSGVFLASMTDHVLLSIAGNPMCAGLTASVPTCDFYAATFERLFRVLVHPGAKVIEVACEARGDPACCFEVRW